MTARSCDLCRAEAIETDIAVSKLGPEQAAAGSDVSYTVTVSNFGPDAAGSITLTDVIPAGMTFVSAAPPGCSTPPPGSGGTITCLIAGLAAFTDTGFTFVFHIPSATPPGTFFTNIATAVTPTDPNSENNSGVAVTSTPPPVQADMAVSKDGPVSVPAGANVIYTITVTNGGPSDATVSLTDTLPPNTTFVSASQTTGLTFTCMTPAVGTTGTITCTIATLASGAVATFSIVLHVSPTATGSITNVANVSTTTADPTPGNDSASAVTQITPVAAIPVLSPFTFALLGITLAVVGFFALRVLPYKPV